MIFATKKTSNPRVPPLMKSGNLVNIYQTSKDVLIMKKKFQTKTVDYGATDISVIFAAVITGVAATLATQVINSANDGTSRLNLRSKVGLGKSARLESIREKAFNLYCSTGCTNVADQNLSYDATSIENDCTNQTFGDSLIDSLEDNVPNLTEDFSLQDYDPGAPAITIDSQITADGNAIIVTFSESTTGSKTSTKIVPLALGWCR